MSHDEAKCLAPDTYIVTLEGVKRVLELAPGERALCVDPATLRISVGAVLDVWSCEYDGPLVILDDAELADLAVTPDHPLLVRGRDGRASYVPAGQVAGGEGYSLPAALPLEPASPLTKVNLATYAVRHRADVPQGRASLLVAVDGHRRWVDLASLSDGEAEAVAGRAVAIRSRTSAPSLTPASVEVGDLLELAGFYISAGAYYDRRYPSSDGVKKIRHATIVLNRNDALRLVRALARLGVGYRTEEYNDVIEVKFNPYGLLEAIVDEFGVPPKASIPAWVVLDVPSEARRRMIEAMTWPTDRGERAFVTRDRRLLDEFVLLSLSAGYHVRWQKVYGLYRAVVHPQHEVPIGSRSAIATKYRGVMYGVATSGGCAPLVGRGRKYAFAGPSGSG